MDDACTTGGSGLPGELEELLAEFTGYCQRERALAPTTVENYLNQVRPFMTWCARHRRAPLAQLTIHDVHHFLRWRSSSCSAGSLTVAASALRALLRWMFLVGRLDGRLAEGIGPVRYPKLVAVPKALPMADLALILALEMSARDRAVVLLLARLGLRSSEAAGLLLEDVDWRAGTIRITGKGDDHQLMPLPAEVGEALASYLEGDRPGCADRHIFLGAIAPHEPIDRNGVSCVVTRLARRAGLDGRVGAHRLRHGAASAVLAGGGTLTEAGQLLRHRSSAATAIYAKVDDLALRSLVRPWPATPVQAR